MSLILPTPRIPPNRAVRLRWLARQYAPLLLLGGILALAAGLLVVASMRGPEEPPADALVARQAAGIGLDPAPAEAEGGAWSPAGQATLAVYTMPVGAIVSLDGEPAGTTPFRDTDLAPGTYRVTLSADGYAPFDTTLRLGDEPHTMLVRDLQPTSGGAPGRTMPPVAAATPDLAPSPAPAPGAAPAPAPPPGAVAVLARPWGSIYVNGDLVARETDVRHTLTLPAGRHRVRAEHTTLGSREVTVEVRPGRTTTVELDLTASSD